VGNERGSLSDDEYRRGFAIIAAAFRDVTEVADEAPDAGEDTTLVHDHLSHALSESLRDVDADHSAVNLLAAVAFDAAAALREIGGRGGMADVELLRWLEALAGTS
jgi:hypothetical protein